MTDRRVLAFWLVLAVAWFATLPIRPLLEPDEGRYAEIPREMWVSGDWVTPHLNGVAYLEKPPLQYWGTAVAYSLFGVQEWSARLWALALSFLALPLVGWATARLYGSREAGSVATVALATSPYYAIVGQLNTLDGAFATLLMAAVFALVLGQREPDAARRRPLLLLAWIMLGLAVLSKGIVAPLLAGGTLVAYSLVTRDWSPWRRMHWTAGLAAFAVVVVPWFWLVSARNPDFLYFFFVHEHFARFLTTVHRRAEPWWYFAPIALVAVLPWLRALPQATRGVRASPAAATGFRPALFLALWVAVVILFFSASGSKLATYILPCMPAVAVLLGPVLQGQGRQAATAAMISAACVGIVAVGLCIGVMRQLPGADVPVALAVWAAVAVIVATASWVLVRRDSRDDAPAWAPLAVGAMLAWQALLTAYAAMPPLHTTKPLVAQVREFVRPTTRIYSVQQYRQTVPFYLGRTVQLASYRGELEFGLEHAGSPDLPTLEAFAAAWEREDDAIAFLAPEAHAALATLHLPGRIVAADGRSIVMVRR